MEKVNETLQCFGSYLNGPTKGFHPAFADLLAEPIRRNRMTMEGGQALWWAKAAMCRQD
jgi:hypothetical protein